MPFEELTLRISTKLKGIVYKVRGSCPSLSAEDLYQEAVLHLWLDHREGKLSDKTDSYVLQGCYFYLKNFIRSLNEKMRLVSANSLVNEQGTELQELIVSDEQPSLDEEPDHAVLLDKIISEGLDPREKDIISLYLQGRTTREIGEKLGISHVSVVKLENRIKVKCIKLKNSL